MDSLERYRERIDDVNADIVAAVARRMEVVNDIQAYKEERGMDVRDLDREDRVRDQFATLFDEHDLPPEKGRDLADLLIDMAVEAQE